MGSREYLGEFEHVVLLALARLGENGHGAAIHKEILETAGRDVSIPAVYVTLKRMEGKGLVSSSAPRDAESGGRPKRLYQIEPAGREALARSRALLERLWGDGAGRGGPAVNARIPKVARAILSRLVSVDDRAYVLRDLEERFEHVAAESGIGAARRWYWSQVLRGLPALLRSGSLTGGWPGAAEVRQAARALRRRPLYLLGVSGTMALGLASSAAVFLIGWHVWLAPLSLPRPGPGRAPLRDAEGVYRRRLQSGWERRRGSPAVAHLAPPYWRTSDLMSGRASWPSQESLPSRWIGSRRLGWSASPPSWSRPSCFKCWASHPWSGAPSPSRSGRPNCC